MMPLNFRPPVYVAVLPAIPIVFLVCVVVPFCSADNIHPMMSSPPSPVRYSVTNVWKALHLAKSAYCPVAEIKGWSCGSACFNASPDFQVFDVYDNASTGNLGFSGLDHKRRRIVIAFRGTNQIVNWLENLDFWATPYPQKSCGDNCRVHRGFYAAYGSIRQQMLHDVQLMLDQYPSYTIFVTGHSLGAAIALLAAVELRSWRVSDMNFIQDSVQPPGAAADASHVLPVELYTFGEPRVGNEYFTNWSASVLDNGRHFRITHARDPVPHLPPRRLSYVHVPQEFWYPANSDTVVQCQDTSYTEDPLCSNSLSGLVVSDHLIYLGICTQCQCTDAVMENIYSYKLPTRIADIIASEDSVRNHRPQER